jgi:hypothetical protein
VLVLFVHASFATDRVIRRRSIRMIYTGPPLFRRVLHNRGLTVVTLPADTDCTIRLENRGAGLAQGRPRLPLRRRATAKPSQHHLGPQSRRARAQAHAHRVMTAHAVGPDRKRAR